jgi:Zn-dependent protease
MLGSSYKIATVWGIPIKIHISLVILIVLMAISSGMAGGLEDLLKGLLLAFCIFTSIALHELGHSFVAIRKGCRVREITLLFVGGVAQMERIPTRPRDELLMAIAGPLVSIAIGAVCLVAGMHMPLDRSMWPLPFTKMAVVCNTVEYLALWNFGVAAFNLLPSFPMDGGRVLRALLTRKKGRLRATQIAARFGKIMSVVFVIAGIKYGDWILVLIAFFIYTAAGNEYRMVQIQEAAKNQGFGIWPPFGNFWGQDTSYSSDDKVIISPPPYKKGPDDEAELRTMRKRDPFSDLFGQ